MFARGSGQSWETGETFLEFQKDMALAAKQAKMSYRITNLDYQAVGILADNVLGTYVSAGEAYDFGRSVDGGARELKRYAGQRSSCTNTYWVLSGYSQGAMVIANSLEVFDADKIVYIAMFGDPKLYLPEGEGFNPPACRGEDLSEYRVFVPDCDTDNGILGAREPYEMPELAGRYGLWCNDNDFICGSSKNPFNTKGHSLYEENGSVRTAAMYVLRRLNYLRRYREPLKRTLSASESVDEEKLGSILARLPQYRYDINVGEELTFDASESFSVDGNELKYTWFIGDDVLENTGETLSYRFDIPGIYTVGVEASDALGEKNRTDATVMVGWEKETVQTPALPNIHAERCGEKRVCLSWMRMRNSSQYLGLRINDSFFGFVDISNESLVIDDVDFSNINISMSAAGADYDMGDMSELTIEGVAGAVPTSATLSWWRILTIALLPLGFLVLVRIACRLVRDVRK